MKGERKRSAGILARKPGELNPPYAGGRLAADAGYKGWGVWVARWSPSFRDAPLWRGPGIHTPDRGYGFRARSLRSRPGVTFVRYRKPCFAALFRPAIVR